MGFPDSSVGKESPHNAGDVGSIPGLGRCTGDGIGYPLQYSWTSLLAQLLKNPPSMQETGFNLWIRKIRWRRERLPTPVFWPEEFHGLVHGVAKSQTELSEFHFHTSIRMDKIQNTNKKVNIKRWQQKLSFIAGGNTK